MSPEPQPNAMFRGRGYSVRRLAVTDSQHHVLGEEPEQRQGHQHHSENQKGEHGRLREDASETDHGKPDDPSCQE